MSRHARSVVALLALLASSAVGCFEVPSLEPRDAARRDVPPRAPAGSLSLVAVHVRDARGAPWAPDVVPRQPAIELVFTGAVTAPAETIFLLGGPPDEALRDDAARRPLTQANLARIAPANVWAQGTSVHVEPLAALPPGHTYTLLVAGFTTAADGATLGNPELVALHVSPDASAGAAVVASFPADGTLDVPTNVEALLIAFDGALELGGLATTLRYADDMHDAMALAHDTTLARCAPLGLVGEACLAVRPRTTLPAATRLELVTNELLRDATGAPLPVHTLRFTTALGEDVSAPRLREPVSCPIDASRDTTHGCIVATDRSWRMALSVEEPVRLELAAPGQVLRALAPRGAAELVLLDRAPSWRAEATLTLVDLAGLRATVPLVLETSPTLVSLTITEVCANPEGPEPTQEWVELANFGAMPASLEGLAISDRADAIGTRLGSSRVLVPGARVLLVGEGFDADRAGVPAGAALLVVGRSIVPSGISNTGEPLYLRDGAGHRLAHVPAGVTREGECIVRRATSDPRADALEDFHYDACSPGR